MYTIHVHVFNSYCTVPNSASTDGIAPRSFSISLKGSLTSGANASSCSTSNYNIQKYTDIYRSILTYTKVY